MDVLFARMLHKEFFYRTSLINVQGRFLMSYHGLRLGNTVIHYRIDELFRALEKSSPLSVFACTIPPPLGNTHIILLQNGGRFDVMAWFGGPTTEEVEIDPVSLLEQFAEPFGRLLRLDPYDAYVISPTNMRDFVVSYEPQRGEFLFSTSIALTGVDARSYVLESPRLNGLIFAQVFTAYTEILREFIDFVYHAHSVHVEQLIGLRVSRENLSLNEHPPEVEIEHKAVSRKILPFVRPKK